MVILVIKKLVLNFVALFSNLRPSDKSEKRVIAFSLIYFTSIGILFLLSVQNNNHVDVMGFDTYSHIAGDNPKLSIIKALKWNIRHPLLCLIYSPILLIDKLIGISGIDIHWYLFILLSSIMMSFCILLLFKILRQLNTSLFNSYLLTLFFGSFSYIILLSVQVESFLLTLFFTLLFILITLKKKNNIYTDNLFFFFLVGTTSTNCLKLLAASFVLENKFLKSVKRFFYSIPLFSVIFLLTSLGLLYRRFFKHFDWFTSIMDDTIAYTGTVINKFTLFGTNFLSEPLMFHSSRDVIYGQETQLLSDYPFQFYQPVLIFIYLLVILSVFLNRKEIIAKLFMSFISIDMLIHFGVGYGVTEAQLFSAHWFFFIPILLGMIFNKLTNWHFQTFLQVSIGSITILFLINNLYCFFNSLDLKYPPL